MPLARVVMVVICGLLAGLAPMPAAADDATPPPEIAAMTADEIVALRVQTMRSNGRTLRGANTLSGAEAVAAAEQVRDNAHTLHFLFPEGSNTGDSNALGLIWQDWDNFLAILDNFEADAGAMLEAAQSGDQDSYVAAVRRVGMNCGTCHQTYRAELQN
jgi:cytochrome c556